MRRTSSDLSTEEAAAKPIVAPLKSRTMTLGELQMATLSVLNLVRKQLRRNPAKGGMSDEEFIEHVVEPLETDIRQDRHVLKDAAKRKKAKK